MQDATTDDASWASVLDRGGLAVGALDRRGGFTGGALDGRGAIDGAGAPTVSGAATRWKVGIADAVDDFEDDVVTREVVRPPVIHAARPPRLASGTQADGLIEATQVDDLIEAAQADGLIEAAQAEDLAEATQADGPVEPACDGAAASRSSSAPPEVSVKVRRLRRTRPRGTTIAMKRVTLADLAPGAELYPPVDLERPRTRADCGAEARPCPWVACKHHLYLDINPTTGSIKINFPDREPWELEHTCALDVADTGGKTLDEIGEITNLTRERIRQVEAHGLIKLRTRREIR